MDGTKGSKDGSAEKQIDVSAFHRDQPPIGRLFRWDGRLVAEADRFYAIDVEKAVADPVQLPGGRKVIALATGPDERPLALCRQDEELILVRREDGEWRRLELPKEVRESAEDPGLCDDESSMVLLGNGKAFQLAEGTWTSVPLKERPETASIRGRPNHLLLLGRKLYLGFDRGEWGGGLLLLDVKTGEWQEIKLGEGLDLPIRDLTTDPQGKIWVVEGLNHLGLRQGRLSRFDGKGWKVFCDSSPEHTASWNLPPASLDALSFDSDCRPYLLSGELGLVRHDGEKWARVTPGWPDYMIVQGLQITRGGVAVIGAYDAGVMLLDLRTKRVRRVVLRK
jgi:hypothetical protein